MSTLLLVLVSLPGPFGILAQEQPLFRGQPVEHWRKQLQADGTKKAEAVEALSALAPQDWQPLVTVLKSRDRMAVRAAILALRRLDPDPKATVAALKEVVQRWPGSDLSHLATVALTEFGVPPEPLPRHEQRDTEKVAALLKQLQHQDAAERRRALRLLRLSWHLPREASGPILKALRDDDPEVRVLATGALTAFRPPQEGAIKALLTALQDKEERVRQAAILALGAHPVDAAEAVSALVEVFQKQPALRPNVAATLELIGLPAQSAISVLTSAAQEPERGVRQSATAALLSILPQPKRSEWVAGWLKKADTEDREWLVGQLPGDAAGEKVLLELARDQAEAVRAAAVSALAQYFDSLATARALAEALGDSSRSVRQKVADATFPWAVATQRGNPDEVVAALLRALTVGKDVNPRAALQCLAQVAKLDSAKPAAQDLLRLARHSDMQVRRQALRVLGRLGPMVKDQVLEMFQQANRVDRVLLGRTLLQLDPRSDEPGPALIGYVFEAGSSQKSAEEQEEVKDTIRLLGRDLLAAVRDALRREDPARLPAALTILQELGPVAKHAAPVLLEAVLQKRVDLLEGTRLLVRMGLAESERSKLLGPLLTLLGDNGRAEGPEVVASLGKTALPALREAVSGRDLARARTALLALQWLRQEAAPALSEVQGALRAPYLREEAAHTLGAMGAAARDAAPALKPLLEHRCAGVRRAAIEALCQLGGPDARATLPLLLQELRSNRDPADRWNPRQMAQQTGDSGTFAAYSCLALLAPDIKEALPLLLDDLKRGPWAGDAAAVLVYLGPLARDAVPLLLPVLSRVPNANEFTSDQQSTYLHLLGRIGPEAKAAIPYLRWSIQQAHRYPFFEVPAQAAVALWRIDPTQAEPARALLRQGLTSPNRIQRAGAALALADLGAASKEFVPELQRLVNDPDQWVREQARETLEVLKGS